MLNKLTDDQLADLAKGIVQGEWCLRRDVDPEYVWGPTSVIVKDCRGFINADIAKVYPMPWQKEEQESNAQAIALAPQLLAEAIQSRRTLERYRGALFRINQIAKESDMVSDGLDKISVICDEFKED